MAASSEKAPSYYDIMMCYSRTDAKKASDIIASLQSKGYFVFDSMKVRGSLTKLAEGVEKSVVLLICASDAFAEDKHCGQVAEYANEKEKSILFLKVQEQFTSSGLLGILMGAQEAYDFTGRQVFAKAMETLCEDLPPPSKHKAFEQAVEAFKSLHMKVRQRRRVQDGDRKK